MLRPLCRYIHLMVACSHLDVSGPEINLFDGNLRPRQQPIVVSKVQQCRVVLALLRNPPDDHACSRVRVDKRPRAKQPFFVPRAGEGISVWAGGRLSKPLIQVVFQLGRERLLQMFGFVIGIRPVVSKAIDQESF